MGLAVAISDGIPIFGGCLDGTSMLSICPATENPAGKVGKAFRITLRM
jgi:hypothetical protein